MVHVINSGIYVRQKFEIINSSKLNERFEEFIKINSPLIVILNRKNQFSRSDLHTFIPTSSAIKTCDDQRRPKKEDRPPIERFESIEDETRQRGILCLVHNCIFQFGRSC